MTKFYQYSVVVEVAFIVYCKSVKVLYITYCIEDLPLRSTQTDKNLIIIIMSFLLFGVWSTVGRVPDDQNWLA